MPNHVALHGFFFESPQLGDIGIGYAAGRGAVEQSYYPGELTLPRLDKIMSGQEKAPTFTYENNTSMESPDGTVNFHLNMGKRGEDKNAYMKSDWYRSRSWTSYFGEYATLDHVFFNVHPLANKKRDIDKWGVEKTLAQALQSAISQGKATYFPFMDDPTPEGDKSVVLGAPQYLGASNCIFAPVVPPTTYTIGNAEADVGNIGTFGYWGGTPTFGGPATPQGGGSSGLTNYHAFESNLITDRFEKDTHILVELNFSKYQDGPIILTIECAGEDVGAVSCIADPLHSDAFTVHNNQDSFLVYNQFSQMYTGLTTATFRPELPPNSRKVDNPKPGDYAPELGYTSNLADEPGLQPGRVISLYSLTDKDAITWYYYNIPTDQPPLQDYENDNKTKLTFTEDASIGMVTIPIDSLDVWHTRLQMNFTVTDATKLDESSDEILALFKAGDSVEGAIDRSRIDRTSGYPSISLWVQHLKGSTIVVTGESLKYLKVNSILIQSVKQAKADNYLLNIERDTSGETLGNRPAVTQPIFFKTSIATIGEDSKSNLFVFMTDSNDGISAVSSPNYGVSWLFYYGVVEPIGGNKIEDPFVLNDHTNNLGYLFFRMQNKIFCKIIPYEMFLGDDAQLVESSDKDVFVYDTQTGKVIEEKDSVYSDNGIMLRRRMPAFIAAGNTATGDTRYLLGIADQSGNVADEHFETRKVGTGGTIIVPKNIAALSPTTLIGNYDIDTRFFSATRHLSNLASLRLWFLQQIKDEKGADGSGGGGSLLQCHLSNDDGKTWIDQWESIHYGLTRAKSDETKNLMFIDTAGGATDAPDSGRVAQFGVNLHWSALREHKVSDTEWQEKKEEAESHALEVKSPYAFYHSESKMIFMFYIYEGCLLCRRIDEQLFADCVRATDTPDEGNGMNKLKDIVERRTKADFVDGYLNKTSLLAELGYTGTDQEILDSLKQSLKDNKKDDQQLFNIRFGFHENVKNFGTERTINPQRVCAYESSQGYVRVFYKFNDDFIRSAIWNGSFWMAEDFLKQIGATE
jgi:hypothetical protein